ncbi:hypothetical protein [Pseudooceanicola sp. LIPI14-2-Ac024]|uniref:hypothetical protein n=1 Tax=Pseudooceanicola sp. LIPI14-2-Ac024 TaxID=3344875 RepID=UPI0035CEFCE2
MTTYLTKELIEGIAAAQKLSRSRKRNRLRVRVGDEVVPVLQLWETGFAVETAAAPRLRGLVDIYDGSRHLFQCLIVASEDEAGEMRYEFKRATAAMDRPPLDFVRGEDQPIGLIPRF